MQLELERGHHTEVATTSAERPEEILVLTLARDQEPSVGSHDVGRDQVVQRETEAARQVPDAASEREAGDPGRRDDAPRRRQAERIRRGVEVAPRRPALGPSRRGRGIHPDAAHSGEVDHDPVTCAEARNAVPSPADRQVEPVLASQVHGSHHVADVGGSDDHDGSPVDHGVVDVPRLLVRVIVR